jgi:hypothetical protein
VLVFIDLRKSEIEEKKRGNPQSFLPPVRKGSIKNRAFKTEEIIPPSLLKN